MNNKQRKKQFTLDEQFGHWCEEQLIDFVEKFFSTDKRKVSFWYDSKTEYNYLINRTHEYREALKKYDLKFGVYEDGNKFPKKGFKIEIKGDKYKNTGNVFFELECSKKASGIMATEAEYFIYWLPRFNERNLYIISCNKLKELLKQERWNSFLNYSSGDDGRVKALVIPKDEFNEVFLSIGGKIETFVKEIPERFDLIKFENDTIYNCDKISKYETDNFDKFDDLF